MWNICLRSGGGEMLGVLLGSSFVSTRVSKLGVVNGYVGRTMFVLAGGDTDVAVLVQEYIY